MNFKFTNQISKDDQFAEMFIYNDISDDKVNGEAFAFEMRYLRTYENVKGIRIKINSGGGWVNHAESIVAEMIDAEKNGVEVHTHGNGLMASSAAVIWCAAKPEHRHAKDYSRAMFHGVAPLDENADLNANDNAAMMNIQNQLIQILSNRTGKKVKFFEDLFTNGKDNWFDVKMLVKAGLLLACNVEDTNIKIDIKPEETTAGVMVVYNKIKNTLELNEQNINQNPIQMKKVIALLKLQDAASEEAVETAVITLQNSLKEKETAVSTKDAKIVELENKLAEQATALKTAQDAAATEFVNLLVTEGKIEASKKEEAIVQAKNNLDAFKTAMSFVTPKAANIINGIRKEEGAAAGEGNAAVDTRSFRELEKNAPAVLNALKKDNLKEYVNKYNAQYNTDKTEEDFK